MSPELTSAEKEYAKQAAARWFRYERAHEKHMQALRKDFNQAYEARAQYKREMKPLPEGYMPATEAERRSCTTQAEEAFLKHDNGVSFYDHTAAASAALFLCSIGLRDVGEKGWEVYLETLRLRRQMDVENPHVVDPAGLLPNTPQQIHPDLEKELTTYCTPSTVESDTPMEFPPTMPIRAKFYWSDVNKQSAVQVTSHQILQWKQDPEPLQRGKVFITGVDGTEEAFKVSALLTASDDRTFYVQFVEEDQAFAYSNDHFFEMLKEAKQVQV